MYQVQTKNRSKTSKLLDSSMPSSAEGLKALCQRLQHPRQAVVISSWRCSSTKTEHWFSLVDNQDLRGLPSCHNSGFEKYISQQVSCNPITHQSMFSAADILEPRRQKLVGKLKHNISWLLGMFFLFLWILSQQIHMNVGMQYLWCCFWAVFPTINIIIVVLKYLKWS